MTPADWRRLAEMVRESIDDVSTVKVFAFYLADALEKEAEAARVESPVPSPEPDPVPVGSRWRWKDDDVSVFTVISEIGRAHV